MILSVLTAALVAATPCERLSPVANPAAPDSSSWRGVFALNRAESDDLDEVVEQATRQMRRRVRKRAADALRQRLDGPECLRLTSDTAGITIESERGVRWVVDPDGSAESGAPRAKGRTVPATVSEREIAIGGEGERGEARYVLRRSSDGRRVTAEVYFKGERLEQPISYRLVYDAVPGSAAGRGGD